LPNMCIYGGMLIQMAMLMTPCDARNIIIGARNFVSESNT